MIEWTENPDETDFPLIDRCVVCDRVCDWQPRYEIAARPAEHKALLAGKRPLDYVPEHRVVKICSSCIPEGDPLHLIALIRFHYPVLAKERGI